MKYNKSADALLFLLLFTTSQREKSIEKTLFVSAGAQKRRKQRVLGVLYRNMSNPRRKFPLKFRFA